jgi:hypothetical protein
MAKREVNERSQREMGDFFTQSNGVLPDRAMQPLGRSLPPITHIWGANES